MAFVAGFHRFLTARLGFANCFATATRAATVRERRVPLATASAVIRSVFEHPDTAEASGTPPKDQAVTEHYVAQFRFVYGTHVQYNAKSELFRGSAVPALPGVLVFDN